MGQFDYDEDREPMENVAMALYSIAYQLKQLGNADAATPMGALEAHGKAILDAAEAMASSMDGIASELHDAGDRLSANVADIVDVIGGKEE